MARRLKVGFQQHLDGNNTRQGGHALRQIGDRIEALRWLEMLVQRRNPRHAIKSERAQPSAQMAHAHHIPAPAAPRQAVGVEVALGVVALGRAVVQVHALPGVRGAAQGQQGGVVAGRHGRTQVQRHGFTQGTQPLLERRGHHTLQLGLGAFYRQGRFRQSQLPRRQKAHGQGQRLVVGEHPGCGSDWVSGACTTLTQALRHSSLRGYPAC